MAKTSTSGQGRPKGIPNKVTKALKDMILGALDDVGGQDYLARQAEENPVAFLGLVGKVLPNEIKATTQSETKSVQEYRFVGVTKDA